MTPARPRFGQHGQRPKTSPVRNIRAQVRLLQDLGSDAINHHREEPIMPIGRYTVTEPGNFYNSSEPSPLPRCGVELVDKGRTVVVDTPGGDLPAVVIHHAPLADYQVLELSEWADEHGLLWSIVPGVDGTPAVLVEHARRTDPADAYPLPTPLDWTPGTPR